MVKLLLWTVGVCLTMVACGQNSVQPEPEPTSTAVSMTTTVTEPQSTTSTLSAPATSEGVSYDLADCDVPPANFALLCDVYDYVDTYHVDSPFDPASLAAGAAVGIDALASVPGVDPPEKFTCAVPDPAFESSCRLIARRLAAGEVGVEEAVEAAVSSMVELSLDPFTYYVPPELSGALSEEGIVLAVGLLLRIADPADSICVLVQDPCHLEVSVSVQDGAASAEGIVAGDVITGIDDTDVAGLSLVDVAGLLDGQADTAVTVQVQHSDGTSEALTLIRQERESPSFDVELVDDDTGYLRIPDFEVDVPEFVHESLDLLLEAGASRLILDLRDNPGGFVDVATLVASEFLDDGLVFKSLEPSGNLDYPVQPGGLAIGGTDIVVLVNSGSASAAEIVAGVLQERGRAEIVGESTFGKNTVQIGFRLRNDGQLRVTIARWVTPGGQSVAITGVTPDRAVDIPSDATPSEIVKLVLR